MDTKHPENLWVTSVPEEESSSVFEKMKNFKAEYPEKLATFNREIEAYFEKRSAKSQDLAVKERVRDELQKVANEIFPRCEVVIGGSTASHLATAKSDLDLCLFVAEVDGSYAQNRDSTLRILRRFYDSLRINLPSSMADIEFIHWARVPIVILKCTREYDNLQVDIPCNKVNSMKTTHLIYHYVRFDDRVAKLKLAVKCWATNIGILNSMQGRLSSFHLTLMVIHFLQSVCTPSILPNLDKLFPGAFEKSHVWDLHRNECTCVDMSIKNQMLKNDLSVGELFLGFIAYYDQYSWKDWAIDVRSAKRQFRTGPRSVDMDIQEPYEGLNSIGYKSRWNRVEWPLKRSVASIFEKGALEAKDFLL